MSSPPRILAVSSGKGGVGKTNFVANLAIAYAQSAKRVLVFDADLGLSNIDVMLGIAPKYNLKNVLLGQKHIDEIVVSGPAGIRIIPASSGVRALTNLTAEQKLHLITELENFKEPFDVFLIDTGAGINDNVLFFCSSAQESIVIITPEPTSIADAYALIKVLSRDFRERHFRILVNMAKNEREAFDTFRKLYVVADKFLNLSLDYLGFLPFDADVKSSIMAQKPFILQHPTSQFCKRLTNIAKQLYENPINRELKGVVQFFRDALRTVDV